MPQLNLTKGHGCGFDVLVVDSAPEVAADGAEIGALVRQLCDRRGPLGAEAVYFVDGDSSDPAVWGFAADGVSARGSAYGLGVVGRVLLDRRGVDAVVLRLAEERFPVRRCDESPEGVKRVAVETSAVSLADSWRHVGEVVPDLSASRPLTSVEVPEPQLVSVVGRYDEDELVEVGRRVEAAREAFPIRPDVSFLMPLDEEDNVFVRTYECGVGVTRSSAAGAVAARATYSRLGIVGPGTPVLVRTPGGPVRATLRVEGDAWTPVLETNATLTYSAEVESGLLAAPNPVRLDLRARVDEVMAYAAFRSANARELAAAGVSYSAP